MLIKIKQRLFAEKINGKVYYAGGLKKQEKDPRDFEYKKLGFWGLGSYKPKHEIRILPSISVKDQAPLNTCTQESYTGLVEPEESVELAEQGCTCFARQAGVISGNGFSSLREIQKVGVKYGIPEKRLLNASKDNWEAYSSINNLTQVVKDNALIHRSKSFWLVSGREERLKALDDGHRLHTGMEWWSGFNMNGGFKAPWIIDKFTGWKVGGHAFYKKGYVFGFKGIGADKRIIRGSDGVNVYVHQNSYGKGWGANFIDDQGVEHWGCFFTPMDFFDKFGYETYARLDIEVNTASFLNAYAWRFVKSADPTKKGIYLIIGQKKHPFPSWIDATAWGYMKGMAEPVSDDILFAVETGEPLLATEGEHWNAMKESVKPDNLEKIRELTKFNP